MFELRGWTRPRQRLPDLALNLFLRLGGHVELPNNIFHKPTARLCRELSWRRRKRLTLDEMTFLLGRFDHIAGFVSVEICVRL